MTALKHILNQYRDQSLTEREKGTYFELLTKCYFENEASYKDLYDKVWMYADWAKEQRINAQDAGIDLVARTAATNEFHAIQCKLYAEEYTLQKGDIDSFFTASGKKIFKHRIIVSTTNKWSSHAEEALIDQNPPVTKIDLHDLEVSQIDWKNYQPNKEILLREKKSLRPHQKDALLRVKNGLKDNDRGQLIMACGTGKTFTSLKIAEDVAGKNGRVLFLVPSLALLSQTLTEWTQESDIPLHSFAVCSDSDVGKKQTNDDIVPMLTHELRYPATTDASSLSREVKARHDKHHMSVIFSTYHSIEVISKAQKKHDLEAFDLIICDEAHRTTGATFENEDESNFVKIHDASFITAKKRLYMTATPRIYANSAKAKAETESIAICSMDDEKLFGKALHVITFSEAVKLGLLVDYKVIVLSVEESHVSRRLQELLKDEDNQLKVDDAAKIIGCWKALAKQNLTQDLIGDDEPMKRAVAFCQVIEPGNRGSVHKVSSKNIAQMFDPVVKEYLKHEDIPDKEKLYCVSRHVDGTMSATEKEEKLNWLKAEISENECRILSNVRCLSEGVDVPALDAVLFLTPRNSQVDVVQSVGRVMRNSPGKNRGYVILPVVIPAGVTPHEALNDNKTYRVVWQVLQALRSHDDRFDAMINKMELDLNQNMLSKMEVIAITDKITSKKKKEKDADRVSSGKGEYSIGTQVKKPEEHDKQTEIQFEVGELERAIYAKVVQKCGNRHHWEDWANDIAKIARTHIDRIHAILEDPKNTKEQQAFQEFTDEIRDDLNDSITNNEIIEMLAQHLITKPVFDALFSNYSFAKNNPVSQAMQNIIDLLNQHRIDKEADTLQAFYESVRQRAEGIDNAAGKQKIIVELYDKFFRNAFPKMTEKLGIVYTPIEVVDFIIHSVNDILKKEFGQTLGSKGVHIIDPFTGTGTFITRLLQSGLITPEELTYKYEHEIHANEIVLLAYYIAAINIEAEYHTRSGGDYKPFKGICLTDTFQLYEKDDLISHYFEDNSNRRNLQKSLDIRVIMGNPPYSVGQKSANDNAQNQSYEKLDLRIAETYAKETNATNKNSLYDSYIKAFRWASDRLGKEGGVICYVSNGSWIDGNAQDGFRKCLQEEFSSIYVFNLRGNARTQGELRRQEAGNVFGGGSRTPIAITLLVKREDSKKKKAEIFYHDIGDYLSQKEKLDIITEFKSVSNDSFKWKKLKPNNSQDWINQRSGSYGSFMQIQSKTKFDITASSFFVVNSRGLETSRDVWIYNFSKEKNQTNIKSMIAFYNHQVLLYKNEEKSAVENKLNEFIDYDTTKISWSSSLISTLQQGIEIEYSKASMRKSLYRPFTKLNIYFGDKTIHRRGQYDTFFPTHDAENILICVSGVGVTKEFSTIITNFIPDLELIGKSQCLPLYYYEKTESTENTLFTSTDTKDNEFVRKDGISDYIYNLAKEKYQITKAKELTKEDIFYYVYGFLHCPDYRTTFVNDLKKMLPRLPLVEDVQDFWAFSKAGRKLADLHINYESVPAYKGVIIEGSQKKYSVTKMRFPKKGQKETIIFNDTITISNIPEKAYEYVVNGKSAIEWIMERYAITTDAKSGITNDPNDWADDVGNPQYILDLLLSVINVSVQTVDIVAGLPKVEF